MNTYNIWIEGYAATGNERGAMLMVTGIEAETFREAVIFYSKQPGVKKGWGEFDKELLSFWACQCYPTEAEARKSFG